MGKVGETITISRAALQKIWDANGAAIYEANQEFKGKHGKEMDAKTKSKAVKDATVNGVFNAGAYASNLDTAEKEEEVRRQAARKKVKHNNAPASQHPQNTTIDSATRSYMAWAQAVEEGKFPTSEYIAYWNEQRKDIPVLTPTQAPLNLVGDYAAALALQQYKINNPNHFRFDFDNDGDNIIDFPDQSNCSNFLSQIWWQAGVRFPPRGDQIWDGSYMTKQSGTFPFSNNGKLQNSLFPWYRTPDQQAFFSSYHGEFRIVYGDLYAQPDTLRNNQTFAQIIDKYPQIFPSGSAVFYYDFKYGDWSHSAIVVNSNLPGTNLLYPDLPAPIARPAVVEHDGRFDYIDGSNGLIRNPNPVREVRSVDDTSNPYITQISIVPASPIDPTIYNLDTSNMSQVLSYDGKPCVVVEQSQQNGYSLLYCPASPSGTTQ